jgi:hypothetical protein
MMIPNQFSPFNIAKVLTTISIATGTGLLIGGTMSNNRPLIIGGVISIIAAALIGIGIMFATRQRTNRPIQNININNPLLVDTV